MKLRRYGTPVQLDGLLRPLIRVIQVFFGLLGTVVLLVMGNLLWMPIPLAVSFVLYELLFLYRGDRAGVLELGESLVWTDPLRKQRIEVRPSEVFAATLQVRTREDGGVDVHISLASREAPLLALQVVCDTLPPMGPLDVNGDAMDVMVGTWSRAVRNLAPNEAVCRQLIEDPDGAAVAWFHEAIPTAAWERTAARLWRGVEPPLDLLGQHQGPHDAWFVLDNHTSALTADGTTHTEALTLGSGGCGSREAVLLRWSGADKGVQTDRIPLLLLDFSPTLTIAIPAAVAGRTEEPRELREETLHTHLPEGQAVVWHLLKRLPEEHWPPLLQRAYQEAQDWIASEADPQPEEA